MAGADQPITGIQRRLCCFLALLEEALIDSIETVHAGLRAGVAAKAMVASFDHLPVKGTEQQVFMQCEHNCCGWAQLFQRINDINAEMKVVMQVDDLGLDHLKQWRQLLIPLSWIKALQGERIAVGCDR